MKKARESIALFLMGEKGLRSLESLLKTWDSSLIECVVSESSKGLQDSSLEKIEARCLQASIPFFLRNREPAIHSQHAFAIGWRWMIRIPGTLITIHDSLLPKYRGFTPLVNQLINGEKIVGATAFLASEEYDRGNILAQRDFEIHPPVRIAEANTRMAEIYCELLADLVARIQENRLGPGAPQAEGEASYSLWRDEEDYWLDWTQDSSRLLRTIYALDLPYPGALTRMGQRKIRITDAVEINDVRIENRSPGKVIFLQDGFPVVVCGKGLLKLTKAGLADTGESVLPLREFRVRFVSK